MCDYCHQVFTLRRDHIRHQSQSSCAKLLLDENDPNREEPTGYERTVKRTVRDENGAVRIHHFPIQNLMPSKSLEDRLASIGIDMTGKETALGYDALISADCESFQR